jgi:hypothetical protein
MAPSISAKKYEVCPTKNTLRTVIIGPPSGGLIALMANLFLRKKYKKTLAIQIANCYLYRVRKDKYKNAVKSTFIMDEVLKFFNTYFNCKKNLAVKIGRLEAYVSF